MLPDRVSNPGPLTYESGALPIALRGPAAAKVVSHSSKGFSTLASHQGHELIKVQHAGYQLRSFCTLANHQVMGYRVSAR